jgi:serine/threonine-protein kinase
MRDALSAGDLLVRRYRLIDQIGSGGMSVIWRARDEVLDRVVAVKVLSPELSADPQLRGLVRDEARNTARLVHPHVAAVHDYGEAYAPDGTPIAFVVLELLAGEPLTARLTEGRLPWPEAVEICAQVADALAAAHRIGIVHRDVTPDNVMLTAVGAKVFDFGIATRVGAPDEDEDGGTFGTPTYVAPERLDGVPARPATDVYALGVVLYETLTGHPPYPANTWEDLARVARDTTPPAPSGIAGLPPEVAELCRRCLDPDPVARPPARLVAETLREHCRPLSPPTRRSPLRTALVVAAVTAVVVGAALAGRVIWPHATPAITMPEATAGSATAPSGGTPTVPGGRIPTPTRPVVPSAAPGRPDMSVVIGKLRAAVDRGQQAGEVRDDVALDLRNLLENLNAAALHGSGDLRTRLVGLRDSVAARAREGSISQAVASTLRSELDALLVAIG